MLLDNNHIQHLFDTVVVSIDRTSSMGGGNFKVTINFPQESSLLPGSHNLYIAAKEESSSQREFIGTSIIIRAVVSVYIPYPGEYIDSSIKIPDVNEGEKVPVEVSVVNKGTANLTVTPEVTFYDDSSKEISKITFDSSKINRGEMDYFRRYLDSEGFKPGSYFAEAVIDYNGQKLIINKTFNIGNLYINITNFTRNLTAGEINKFAIGIKSSWNNKIEGIYADVKLLLNESEIASFRTPSVELIPWENKELEGYLDATTLKSGKYKIVINLVYAGRSTYSSGEVVVLKKPIDSVWFIAGGILIGIAAIIVVAYILIKIFRRKR